MPRYCLLVAAAFASFLACAPSSSTPETSNTESSQDDATSGPSEGGQPSGSFVSATGASTGGWTTGGGTLDQSGDGASLTAGDTTNSGESQGSSGSACENIALAQDGVLDVTVVAIAVEGEVTLGGAPLPNADFPRGALRWRATEGEQTLTLELGNRGAARYAALLPRGSYDIDFIGHPDACSPGQGRLPCSPQRLRSGFALQQAGILDFDISGIRVQGELRLQGKTLPNAEYSRGAISFVREEGAAVTAPLSARGTANYSIALSPGRYDIYYVANADNCEQSFELGLPCNGGLIVGGQQIDADGILDLSIDAVRLSGEVQLAGASLPDANHERGALVFSSPGEISPWSQTMGKTGPGTFALALWPGSYDIHWQGQPLFCQATATSPLPCTGGVLAKGQVLQQDGELDFDVPALSLRGELLLNNTAFGDAVDRRGTLQWTSSDGSGLSVALSATGAARYDVRLFPGVYDINFLGNPSLCATIACGRHQLVAGQRLTESGVFDLDLSTVAVDGGLTVNGQTITDGGRGFLQFSSELGQTTVPLAGTAQAEFRVHLPPDRYDIHYIPAANACADGWDAMPCNSAQLRSEFSINDHGVLDLDIGRIDIGGVVTMDSGREQGVGAPRSGGRLEFIPEQGHPAQTPALPSTGEGAYAVSITPGRYRVRHIPDPSVCRVPAVRPCLAQLVRCGS